jgi:hypothetical protein
MDLAGVELSPAALARHAFDWFHTELRRPVERVSWRTWWGERSLVRFADTGMPVWADGAKVPRKGHPVTITRLR